MTLYNHHERQTDSRTLKEIVFGLEDGMVSTLGAITGIAIGTQTHSTIVLAGMVIIAVESISMGIGSYLSSKSSTDADRRLLHEEKHEIRHHPEAERHELHDMFVRDGWPMDIADQMIAVAAGNRKLMLREMAFRELAVIPERRAGDVKNAVFMFFSYIIGGLVPLTAYFVLSVTRAMPISIGITLVGLFALGAGTTRFTKTPWLASGFRILLLGGLALTVGLLVGKFAPA